MVGDGQGHSLDPIVSPILLYLLIALGGVGVWLALPRRGVNPQPIGGLIAAVAAGLLVVALSVASRPNLPNLYFYIFSVVALGGALRVITHPRPVYAALYFIMTVLASAGLFVILAAEFLAFAFIIVYAGAILITYLFVIMLATQAPSEDQVEVLADYDAESREPLAATVVGFVLLGVLTTMMFRGVAELPDPRGTGDDAVMVKLPHKYPKEPQREMTTLAVSGGASPGEASAVPRAEAGEAGQRERAAHATNIEGVAFTLLEGHPGAIEIAGVILLMAMLGAVVLARKQVQLDEEAKARHAAQLSDESGGAA
jgi:NADH-quinone oxidoreductase subunit J